MTVRDAEMERAAGRAGGWVQAGEGCACDTFFVREVMSDE